MITGCKLCPEQEFSVAGFQLLKMVLCQIGDTFFRILANSFNHQAVPGTGIEPAHCCQYQILSLARLPVPPSGR